MAILNMTYSVSGSGGGNIGEPLNLTVTTSGLDATIKWTDNEIGTIPVTTFQKSELVRKIGSAPTSPSDGTLVVTETVKDTYKTTGYVDQGLTDGETYYYRVFSYSDLGGISYCDAVSVTISSIIPRDTITGFNYDNISFGFGSQEQEVQGMAWRDDGNKFYLVGEGTDSVYQYSCSTAYDISTASYDNISLDVSGKTGVPGNIRMKPDGTQLYVSGGWDNPNHIRIYNLSTARDLSTATYFDESPQLDYNTSSIFISPDGLYLYTFSFNTNLLKRRPISTAWDLTSFSTADQSVSFEETQNIYFNPQGTQLFGLRRQSGTKINLYSLSTNWDLTTLSAATTKNISSGDAMALSFNDDGSKMYLCWRTSPNRTMYQYSTTTS